jgi:hypothetical protein
MQEIAWKSAKFAAKLNINLFQSNIKIGKKKISNLLITFPTRVKKELFDSIYFFNLFSTMISSEKSPEESADFCL